MLLATRIRSLREEKGLTQEGLAKMVGVTKSTISYYENGKKVPTTNNLQSLANALAVGVDTLLGNDYYEVADTDEHYGKHLAKEELIFISEIRKNPRLYEKVIEDPKRFAELINKKLS